MSDIDHFALLKEIQKRVRSHRRMSDLIGVTEKTISLWLKGGDARLQAQHRADIESAAKRLGINVSHHLAGISIWDFEMSYEDNLANRPTLPPAGYLKPAAIEIFGRSIASAFGASASVITGNSDYVRALASVGSDFNTYKTVRSRALAPHPRPNLFHWSTPEDLDPDQGVPELRVDMLEELRPRDGLVARYGIPSTHPEGWKADFRVAKSSLQPDQLLMLSIIGTFDSTLTALVDDYKRVASMAASVEPDAVEINTSCPNGPSADHLVYQNSRLLKKVLSAIRTETGKLPLVLKVGFASKADLKVIAKIASDHGVEAISLVGGLRCEAKRSAQGGLNVSAFGSPLKGALSGAPILRFGLRAVQDLVEVREQLSLDFDIIAVGGVSTPADVEAYLKSGATAVQATTAFMIDPFFAIKVKAALSEAQELGRRVSVNRRYGALQNVASVWEELSGEIPDGELLEASVRTLLEWHAGESRLNASGPLHPLPLPSSAEFAKRIRLAWARSRKIKS